MKQVSVALEERSYEIVIASGMIASGEAARQIAGVARGRRALIVTHPALQGYATPIVTGLKSAGLEVLVETIPPGERYKTLRAVERLYTAFVEAGLDRKSLVVAVGGGVLGDVVGFAAASYMRGLPFVQVPTTLLAQVDSSVGGKTGVDLPQGKNLVGAFHQPVRVVIDPDTLATLPTRELSAGLAEVVKYGIIYDASFFAQICHNMPALLRRDRSALISVIARSCEIKAEVVGQDETEQGLRAILNFGHTLGHALEAVTQYRRYKHGEAISLGMIAACLLGEEMGITPPDVTQATAACLRSAQLPVVWPSDVDEDSLLAAARRDKKAQDGTLRFVLARRIGEVCITQDNPETAVRAALARQRQWE